MHIVDIFMSTRPKVLLIGRVEVLPPSAAGQITPNSSCVNLSVHMLMQGGSLKLENWVRIFFPQITHFNHSLIPTFDLPSCTCNAA